MKDTPGNSSDQPRHDQPDNRGRVEAMKNQYFSSSISFCLISNFVQFSSAFVLLTGVLTLEGGALR